MAIDAKKTPLGTVCIQRTPVEPFVKKRKIIDSKQRGGRTLVVCFQEKIYTTKKMIHQFFVHLACSWNEFTFDHHLKTHQLLKIEKLRIHGAIKKQHETNNFWRPKDHFRITEIRAGHIKFKNKLLQISYHNRNEEWKVSISSLCEL